MRPKINLNFTGPFPKPYNLLFIFTFIFDDFEFKFFIFQSTLFQIPNLQVSLYCKQVHFIVYLFCRRFIWKNVNVIIRYYWNVNWYQVAFHKVWLHSPYRVCTDFVNNYSFLAIVFGLCTKQGLLVIENYCIFARFLVIKHR